MAEKLLPNVRFGTSFLDKQYKNYAEKGEVVIDKITGELLLKRKIDGKLISFTQNDKYLHDIMVELRILMKNHASFTYPTESGWFVSEDYNIPDITDNRSNIFSGEAIDIHSDSLNDENKIQFKISTKSNGFFIRPITRATDKNGVEYLTEKYNRIFRSYGGTELAWVQQREKFSNDPTWETTNATMNFNIKVIGSTNNKELTKNYSGTLNIRINDETYVPLPSTIHNQFDTIDSIECSISRLAFPKFEALADWRAANPLEEMKDELLPPDAKGIVEWLNILEFVSSDEDINQNVNTEIIALLDVPHVMRYVGKVDKLTSGSGFIPMGTRPDNSLWTVNNAWAETISISQGGGEDVLVEHETDLDELTDYLFNTDGVNTNFTFDYTKATDIYIEVVDAE